MTEVSRLLSAIEGRATPTPPPNFPLVYDELRSSPRAAGGRAAGPNLQATALVHEAYLRLVGRGGEPATGTAEATSSPPRPRPCGGSSSRPPAARPAASGAATAAAWTWTPSPPPPGRRRRLAGPGRCPRPAGGRGRPTAAELVKLRYFAGLTLAERGRGVRHFPPLRGPPVGLRRTGCCGRCTASNPVCSSIKKTWREPAAVLALGAWRMPRPLPAATRLAAP